MASKMFFAGRLYTSPAVVSQIDDAEMYPRNPAVGNNLAIVGLSDAGEPNVPLVFSDPRDAERVLMGGEGLVAVRKAFAPSAETGGPRTVTFVRVGTATRSTLTLNDSTPSASIVLTSEVWGLPANAIRVKVETGTLRGKKVTTQLYDRYFVGDNLARDAFTVQYTGGLASALMSVSNTQVVLKAGTGGSEATVATIALADFPTIQQLVDRINATTGFVATAAANSELLASENALDGVTDQNVKASAYTAKADLQAVIDWFNSSAETFVSAARAGGASKPPANLATTYMAGATNPAVLVGDWTTAIAALQAVDVQWVVPLSGNASVHAAADAHCIFMSDAGGKERRAVVGPDAGMSLASAKSAAAAINSDRTAFAWPGHIDFDLAGNKVVRAGYMTAVLVAAAFAGVNPGTPLTNKTLRVSGLEYEPKTPVDTDDLISSGVLCVERSERGFKVSRSVSTWLVNDNFNRVEMSCGAASDFVVRAVRDRLNVLLGQKATPRALDRAEAIADSALRALAVAEPAGPGIIVGDAKTPAFTAPRASLDGDVINVSFQCSPVVPLNFVQLGVRIVPYAGTRAV